LGPHATLAGVIALFEAAQLVVETVERPVAQLAAYRLVTPSGELLAAVREHGSPVRSVVRHLGAHASPHARLDLVDAAGSHILDIEKGKVGVLGRLHLSVSLADGVPLGVAAGAGRGTRPKLTLHDPAGGLLGEYRGDIRRHQVLDPRGVEIGSLTRRMVSRDGPMPPGVGRAYDVSFSAAAGVAVRALALASLTAIDMRLF
jgi:hypothetical protein